MFRRTEAMGDSGTGGIIPLSNRYGEETSRALSLAREKYEKARGRALPHHSLNTSE